MTTNGAGSTPYGFEKFTDTGGAGVSVPESVHLTPQGRILDIDLGKWAFGSSGSVYYTVDFRNLVVDTYMSAQHEDINQYNLQHNPPLMHAFAFIQDVPTEGFVADLRRIQPISNLIDDAYIGSDTDSPEFRTAQELYGTQLLVGAIFSEGLKEHFVGRSEFAEAALELTVAVDALASELRRSKDSVSIIPLEEQVNQRGSQSGAPQTPPQH